MVITVASVISSLSGLFVKRHLLATFFNTEIAQQSLEAFWFAFQIPDMMFQFIILGALSAAFIPIFTTQKKENVDRAFAMSSIMMNTLLSVFLVVSVLVFIFAEPLTYFRTGSEFTPYQIDVIITLTRIMLIAQFFFAISNFLTGILQSFQRFMLPAVAPIFYNLGILLGVYLFSDTFGIYSAGMGVVIGAFCHMMIQLPAVLRLGFRYQFSFNLKYPGIQEFFRIMPPRAMSIGANEIRKIMLGFFASSVGNLSFLMMQLALTLMGIPIRYFGVSISQASLPFLSEESTDKDKKKFKKLVLQSLHQIAFLTFPATVLLLILRLPLVRLAFGTSDFPWPATVMTSKLVAIIAISVPTQALVHLLIRAFYALKDTKTPLIVAAGDVTLYIALSTIFVFYTSFGVMGIAAATTITALVEFLLLLFLLDRKVEGFARKEFWIPQIKMLVAAFFMAVFLYTPYKIFDELIFDTKHTVELIALTITTGSIGMLVYIYFAALFEIKELRMLTKLLHSFGPWRKQLAATKEILVETSVEGDDV